MADLTVSEMLVYADAVEQIRGTSVPLHAVQAMIGHVRTLADALGKAKAEAGLYRYNAGLGQMAVAMLEEAGNGPLEDVGSSGGSLVPGMLEEVIGLAIKAKEAGMVP